MSWPAICRLGGKGLLLPFTDGEADLPDGARGFVYAVAMVYFFLGVSIIADTFMAAIEAITSRRQQRQKESGGWETQNVWNETVANLSLMALGSSAPEIFLSLLELLKKNMHAGDLGSATIVGSGAFNLLVIIAVCIVCIPEGEERQIKELPVFYVTALFSLFAYMWLVVVLTIITPNIVDVWEAVLTLLFLPVLIWVSYKVDLHGYGAWRPIIGLKPVEVEEEDAESVRVLKERAKAAGIRRQSIAVHHAKVIQAATAGRNSMKNNGSGSDRMSGRWSVASSSSGGSSCQRVLKMGSVDGFGRSRSKLSGDSFDEAQQAHGKTPRPRWSTTSIASAHEKFEFDAPRVQCFIDRQCISGHLSSKVVTFSRFGLLTGEVCVTYAVYPCPLPTTDRESEIHVAPLQWKLPRLQQGEEEGATAGEAQDTAPATLQSFPRGKEVSQGEVIFHDGDQRKDVTVERPTGGSTNGCEDFVVFIKSAEFRSAIEGGDTGLVPNRSVVTIGPIRSTHVNVVPEAPGVLSFTAETMFVQGSSTEMQTVEITVVRRDGSAGAVTCTYHTERLSAFPGVDYEDVDGVLDFPEGITEATVILDILPKRPSRVSDKFLFVLQDAEGGASFDPDKDGGSEAALLTITIGAPGGGGPLVTSLDRWLNLESLRLANEEWLDQIHSAVYCNGSRQGQAEATCTDMLLHGVALPWKLAFMLVPPTSYCGGWLCFYTSLLAIGLVTAVLADLAELFGCVLGVPDIVTAISFVALGTSMPDLFASLAAATEDPTADASIVNVTGSNSVNVFLGLGLPWTIATIHWAFSERSEEWVSMYPEEALRITSGCAFVVESRNLGFSVLVFASTAVASLVFLVLRRKLVGAELGGPFMPKLATASTFVLYWFGYIALVSWRVLRWDAAENFESLAMMGGVPALLGLVSLWPLATMLIHARRRARDARDAAACAQAAGAAEEGRDLSQETTASGPGVKTNDMLKDDSFESIGDEGRAVVIDPPDEFFANKAVEAMDEESAGAFPAGARL